MSLLLGASETDVVSSCRDVRGVGGQMPCMRPALGVGRYEGSASKGLLVGQIWRCIDAIDRTMSAVMSSGR